MLEFLPAKAYYLLGCNILHTHWHTFCAVWAGYRHGSEERPLDNGNPAYAIHSENWPHSYYPNDGQWSVCGNGCLSPQVYCNQNRPC